MRRRSSVPQRSRWAASTLFHLRDYRWRWQSYDARRRGAHGRGPVVLRYDCVGVGVRSFPETPRTHLLHAGRSVDFGMCRILLIFIKCSTCHILFYYISRWYIFICYRNILIILYVLYFCHHLLHYCIDDS